jgi:hypothetical protein
VSLATQPTDSSTKRCPQCGACIPLEVPRCPSCGYVLESPSSEGAFSWPRHPKDPSRFDSDDVAILQFLPSGTCLPLVLDRSAVLGYGKPLSDDEDVLDLSEFNPAQHGVVSRHCRLQRHQGHLIITDLGSVAGTRLNGEVLPAHDERIVRHGDRLVIGTLHLTITFSSIHA